MPRNSSQAETDLRVDKLELILHHMTVEGERFWQRNGIFVTLSTGLFGLYAIKYKEFTGFENLIYGAFGLVVGWGWRQTILVGNYYAERWRRDAHEFLMQHPDLAGIFRTAAGTPSIPRPRGPGSSYVMIRFSVLSMGLWLLVVGLGAVQIVVGSHPWPWPRPNVEMAGSVCLRLDEDSSAKRIACPGGSETPNSNSSPSVVKPSPAPSPALKSLPGPSETSKISGLKTKEP